MVRSHRKGDRKRGSSRRDSLRRRLDSRPPLAVIVVVCDDVATAPAYFKALKDKVGEYVWLKVVPACRSGGTPNDIVDTAIKEYKSLSPRRKHDSVWALFDTEHLCQNRQQATAAREKAKQDGRIRTVVSSPCYDLWTLLHLEETGRHFTDCAAVIRRIETLWQEEFHQPFGPKAQAAYKKIIDRRGLAADRAKRQHTKAQSITEVYKVIEAIDEACKQSKANGPRAKAATDRDKDSTQP